ncbi:hypothetical protein ABIC60_003632 [Phyllobacterium ifriqiyense]
MGALYSEFIERLRRSLQEHEERIIRLQSGVEKAFRKSRTGEKEDISLQTADHYRRLGGTSSRSYFPPRLENSNGSQVQKAKKSSSLSKERTAVTLARCFVFAAKKPSPGFGIKQ